MPWIEVPGPSGTWAASNGTGGSWGMVTAAQSVAIFDPEIFDPLIFDAGAGVWVAGANAVGSWPAQPQATAPWAPTPANGGSWGAQAPPIPNWS